MTVCASEREKNNFAEKNKSSAAKSTSLQKMVAEGQAEVGCEPLTIPRLCSSPALGGTLLAGVQLSPDGKWLTFLKGREKQAECKDLWCFLI